MADNVIASYSGPLRTIQEAITPNQTTPYICATTDLRNGPVVVEVPAKTDKAVLYGQVVDAWQNTIAGVGPVGENKGAGGKYLFLPPGYKDPTRVAISRCTPTAIASFLPFDRFDWGVRQSPTPKLEAG